MANFIAVLDDDHERRARFEREVEPRLAIFDGLSRGGCGAGSLRVLWAAGARAPVRCMTSEDSVAIIWGEAMDGATGRRLDAEQLDERWRAPDPCPEPLDGYHAALTYRDGQLTVGADILGLYPVYFADLGHVLLVGSSPELFRAHPRFDWRRVDRTALAAIMLTMHLVNGSALWRGIRRLASGHLLRRGRGGAVAEVEQYRVRPSRTLVDRPFSSHAAILSEQLRDTVRRHVSSGSRHGLLLSGGRDSRLLAGYLRERDVPVSALSLGLGRDLEIRCAKAVAKALGFEHHVREIDQGSYPDYALRQVTWEHGAQGFNTITGWGITPLVNDMPARMVNGYVGDSIIGGSHIHWARDRRTHAMSFETFFAQYNAYAIQPGTVRTLARKEVFKDAVDEAIDMVRTRYREYSDDEAGRAWCFDLYHRQRFHVGGELWRLSFAAWPVSPFVDRRLIDLCAGMPACSLAERRVEDAVLCKDFPRLAALPLERFSHDIMPLRPRVHHYIGDSIRRRLRWSARGRERRRYHRIWDLNGPGWLAVRSEAEKFRGLACEWFDRTALDEVLPPPDVPIICDDQVIETSGLKTLLGLVLWIGANTAVP